MHKMTVSQYRLNLSPAFKTITTTSSLHSMKLITSQVDLDHALRTIAPAVGVRSSHPILDCCLIAAAGGNATITGFNLDLGITVTIPAAIDTAGTVALPYRLLAGLVSRMDDTEPVEIADGTVSASGGAYGLAASDAADYPAMPAVEAPSADLDITAGVRACLMATSTDASKQVLQGIHLANGYMEATDGHRLIRLAVDLPDGINLTLPASTMKLLQDRTVGIAAANGQAVIDAGDGITIYSRILDGTYPNVAKLIPATFDTAITLDRHRFARCLERVALIAEAHNSVVKLLIGDKGTMVISAEADASNGTEAIKYTGKAGKLALAFNVHYLLDGLKAFRSAETVTLSANGPTTPVVLMPVNASDQTYLIMPVQIRS
jgi:DNA polymerase-3 subunit beta